LGKKGRGVNLTTHVLLVPRLKMMGIVVRISSTCFAAAAVRRRCIQLRPSSDDDVDDSSAWGGWSYLFSLTFLANIEGWMGASRHRSGGHEFVQFFG
jgi:hypothetical protein